MSTQQQLTASTTLVWHHTFRCFHLRVDNSKRHGRRPLEYIETYGVVFPCGRVAVAMDDLPRKGYENMDDLMESLSQYGKVEIEEVGEVSV